MSRLHSAVIAVMFTFAALADGTVLWVDKAKGWDGEGRGSEDSPYRTIQAAVDAAASGSTIKVKPGVYDEGLKHYNNWDNRVFIDQKVLKIVSTGGKDVTHITGSGSIRCVGFRDAEGSVVEGFTIRDGNATYSQTTDPLDGRGGGVLGIDASKSYSTAQGCVVDCVVSNCVGVRGGAFAGATAVRCWITENSASNSGGAGRKTDFVNCLITRNSGTDSCVYENCKVVNCTVVDNERTVRQGVSLYNSVVLNNSSDGTTVNNVGSGSLDHCVTLTSESVTVTSSITDASPLQFVAPLYDDFRVLKGSDAETAGEASLINSAGVTVPTGVDLHKDLFANSIPASGTIAAGCIQTVVEPRGGAMLFSRGRFYLTRGKMAYGKDLYAFPETYPTQFVVQAVNKGNPVIFSFVVDGADVFPTMEDMICIVPPATPGIVSTNDVRNPNTRYYVNPESGSDSASGTSDATPFKTFEAVYNAVRANGASVYSVVHAMAGDYRDGCIYDGGITNRVVLRGRMRVIGAGVDKSVIWGAPDPSTGEMGINGTRCVYSYATSGCIQGFTIRDGYVDGSTSGDKPTQRGGGVYMNSSSFNTTLHVTDCVITNCWAYRGGAGYSGAYERCHITDCRAGNGVMRHAYLVSCVVDNLHGSEMGGDGHNNMFGRAYNTIFVGRDTSEYIVNSTDGTTFTNCIVMTTKALKSGTKGAGSIAWNIPEFTVESGFTETDPKLADVAGGDYRPICKVQKGAPDVPSPALGGGVWYELPGFSLTDYDGRPLNLIAGKPAVGAYQWPFIIELPSGLTIVIR